MIRKALLAATLSLGFSSFAHADFVKVDLLIEGDGQSVLDTETGKEWLNLSYTKGLSLDEVNEALSIELSGWRIANLDEMLALAESQSEIAGVSHLFWSSEDIYYAKSSESNTALHYIAQSQNDARIFSDIFGGWGASIYGTYGMFLNDYKNEIDVFHSQYSQSSHNNGISISKPGSPIHEDGNTSYSWWLVNDGGVSISSINNPELNIKNPDAPINDVSIPPLFGAIAFTILGLAGVFRKRAV